MNKIFTILVTEQEYELIDKALKDLKDDIYDRDESKEFDMYGFKVRYYIVVTTEETFDKITEGISALIIY